MAKPRDTFSVAYRTGGTARCIWKRTYTQHATISAAMVEIDAIERMGYKALWYPTSQLDSIGVPEGWDADSAVSEGGAV